MVADLLAAMQSEEAAKLDAQQQLTAARDRAAALQVAARGANPAHLPRFGLRQASLVHVPAGIMPWLPRRSAGAAGDQRYNTTGYVLMVLGCP